MPRSARLAACDGVAPGLLLAAHEHSVPRLHFYLLPAAQRAGVERANSGPTKQSDEASRTPHRQPVPGEEQHSMTDWSPGTAQSPQGERKRHSRNARRAGRCAGGAEAGQGREMSHEGVGKGRARHDARHHQGATKDARERRGAGFESVVVSDHHHRALADLLGAEVEPHGADHLLKEG